MLNTLREEQDLTQQELADKVDVAVETISRWENGHHRPSDPETYEKLCSALSVTIKELNVAIRASNSN